MSTETLCWKCSSPYPGAVANCPTCNATNANHDLDAAHQESIRQNANMLADAAFEQGVATEKMHLIEWALKQPDDIQAAINRYLERAK